MHKEHGGAASSDYQSDLSTTILYPDCAGSGHGEGKERKEERKKGKSPVPNKGDRLYSKKRIYVLERVQGYK